MNIDMTDLTDRVHELHADLYAVSQAYRKNPAPRPASAFDPEGLAISVACSTVSALADQIRLLRVLRREEV